VDSWVQLLFFFEKHFQTDACNKRHPLKVYFNKQT